MHVTVVCSLLLISGLGPRGLPDRGVRGRVQPQGAEGRAPGGDGAVGRHSDRSLRPGTQPQDLILCEGTAGVSFYLSFSVVPVL